MFQLEFRGINYCSFFIPPSSLILWPVKVYCFFSSECVKQEKSKEKRVNRQAIVQLYDTLRLPF